MSAPASAGSAFTGVWGTLLLPIADDDGIDWDALEVEIDRLTASGVHGIYMNGTAGEFFAQTEDEFARIAALLAERCRAAALPFQIGCCHTDAWTTLARVREARALSPAGLQVILPDWMPTTPGDQLRFLERIAAEADPVPLVLYSPPHAKVRPTLEQLRALADRVPALVGFKLPGGDVAWHARMQALLGHLSVFVPGHALATGLAAGAAGSYSNVAALNPVAARCWYDQMHADSAEALRVEHRLQAFLNNHVLPLRDAHGLSNPALDKLLCRIGGWTPMPLRLRWPYAAAPRDAAERLRAAAERDIPDFLA